ncbi:hypothetical protein CEXT_7621 [Caerostris extrusa]|uniref:Uncharacterized protein n=1 Tax=Caerostris extrusa TaxID=172846 RepID=A0AAV4XR95_CAEEX|nr:hypothetical protein CEXT_7621 [Caerostris extrusa]
MEFRHQKKNVSWLPEEDFGAIYHRCCRCRQVYLYGCGIDFLRSLRATRPVPGTIPAGSIETKESFVEIPSSSPWKFGVLQLVYEFFSAWSIV